MSWVHWLLGGEQVTIKNAKATDCEFTGPGCSIGMVVAVSTKKGIVKCAVCLLQRNYRS